MAEEAQNNPLVISEYTCIASLCNFSPFVENMPNCIKMNYHKIE